MPIGKGEREEAFMRYVIPAKKGDIIYLYTDGFADQFGGPSGKKFKYKKLNELLLLHSASAMEAQLEELSRALGEWKGGLEQVDDICLLGLKI